jgi:hypothetical protein
MDTIVAVTAIAKGTTPFHAGLVKWYTRFNEQ